MVTGFGRRLRAACATLAAVAAFGAGAQPMTQNFDDITTLAGLGWVFTNNSNTLGVNGWFQGNGAIFASQTGAASSYIGANFLNAGLAGNVSNWLISPNLPALQNGETLSFYSRSAGATPDRVEIRLCAGASCTDVGANDASVGNFTSLLLTINPTQTAGGYPNAWTHYSVVLSGLAAGPQAGRIAFRYFISNTSANGNYIGIDTFSLSGVAVAPVLVSAKSRMVHGTAGTFDLVLNANPLTPSTETRAGPAYSIVFTFDKPVTAGTASVSESAAVAGTPTFNGNEMTVPLTGVVNPQYVSVNVSSVAASDGGTGGTGSARIGFLFGDANQSRQVTVADVGIVNAALLQVVSNANFLYDVNVDGKLTVADKGLVNANLLKKLPAP